MPSIDVTADAAQGVNELGKYGNALDSITSRIDKLNSVTAEFNRAGVLTGATVKSQTGAFETLTQVVNKSGVVVESYYTKNEAAARKADEASAKRAAAEADRLAKQGNLFENFIGGIARTAGRLATFRVFGFITNQLEDGVKAAKDFQIQLSLIRTISQGNDQQSFAQTGRNVRSVSDTTGFSVKDVGKAFYDATSNQITKGADTSDFVKKAADFARVTGSTLPDAVNLLSTAINSYGLSAADAEKVSAIFFKTIDEGRVVASEMANTLGRLYPLADQVGVSMTEVNSVIAITTQKGVKTSDAITLMSNLLVKLEKPTEQTQEFFKSLGVSSGEAAIQLYGFTGVIQKMVDAVNSGQVPVSAFFDEIRGRKQFAVFQQSIGEIDAFNKKLKDTGKVVSEYRAAVAIRGESSGDALSKELNKLANVFRVDLGQAILDNLNIVNKWVGGVDGIRDSVGGFSNVLTAGAIAVGGYSVIVAGATVTNLSWAASFRAVAASAAATAPLLLAAAVGYASYVNAKAAFGAGSSERFGKSDNTGIDGLIDAVDRYKASIAGVKTVDNPFATYDKQKDKVGDAFKSVLGLVAQANIANNKFLDDAKTKSKEAADAIKISFAGFTDITKKGISDLRKGISDATEEIKRSKKSAEKFGDTGAEALFNFQSKYANDDFGQQKILLTTQKISDLKRREREEEAKGTEEGFQEARRLYELELKETVGLEELKVDNRKKAFEADLQNNPLAHQQPGGNVFAVDDTQIRLNIAEISKRQAEFEERTQKAKQGQIDSNTKLLASETTRLRTLEQALKEYESIDIFNKSGDLKAEYKTAGKFDPKKLQTELSGAEGKILESGGTDPNARFQLLQQLSQRRISLGREAAAQDRAETLKTTEARLQAEKDVYDKKIENLKKERSDLLGKQDDQFNKLLGTQQALVAFGNQVGEAGPGLKGDKKELDRINVAIQEYIDSLQRVKDTKKQVGDITIYDTQALEDSKSSFRNAVDTISQVRDKYDRAGNLSIKDSNNRPLAPGDAKAGQIQLVDELRKTTSGLAANADNTAEAGTKFEKTIGGPIAEITKQFPGLAAEGTKAAEQLNASYKGLAQGGLQDIVNQLKLIQELTPKPGTLPGNTGKAFGKVGLSDTDSDVSYAATGGIVGQFPGQPRGVDRYPVWAAKGEYIINAETSAMYAPMLQAIMQRRAPRYMAEGGVVGGGTTNIGDINISVHGATTNTETARVIGNRLERQLRQNNIRLEPRT